MPTIHLLEHDAGGDADLASALKRGGHETQSFNAAHDYFYQLSKRPPRCVIVDWMFSHISGLEIVQRTRQLLGGHVGIIMLTAGECDEQAVVALGAGADDCMARPARSALLAARIEALLRRLVPAQVVAARRLTVGPYTLDLALRTVTIDGEDARLAPREFDLAWILFSQPSRLLTRDELLALIWGRQSEFGAHTIAQHVYALRKKLDFDAHGFALQSVYASGYRLEPLADAPLRRRLPRAPAVARAVHAMAG
jgi:DNA-binding response OmpR family regulator